MHSDWQPAGYPLFLGLLGAHRPQEESYGPVDSIATSPTAPGGVPPPCFGGRAPPGRSTRRRAAAPRRAMQLPKVQQRRCLGARPRSIRRPGDVVNQNRSNVW